ncbi:hypothetical protein ABZX29_37450, partial [Streptomyces zhihengii]
MGTDRTAEMVALVRHGQRLAAATTAEFLEQMQRGEWFRNDGISWQGADADEFAWLVNNAYDAARHSQMMVPSARDLVIARRLMQMDGHQDGESGPGRAPTTAEAELEAVPDAIEAELARIADPEHPHHAVLRERLARAREDVEIFEDLRRREAWAGLSPAQTASLVVIERHGRQIADAERRHLLDQLRNGEWEWAAGYPLDDSEEMEVIIARAHAYLREDMDITVNVNLGRERDGREVIDWMLDDPRVAYRNTWESGINTGDEYLNLRGGAEEHLGYAASLRRTPESGGLNFSPGEAGVREMPKYAALSFPDFPGGGAFHYGSAVFRMGPHVRERVSHTPQDSLNGSYRYGTDLEGVRSVTGADHLFPLLARGHSETVRRVFAEATGFRFDSGLDHPTGDEYLEAQIHGDVGWRDIDLIRLLPQDEEEVGTYREYESRLTAFAARHGFTFRVVLLTPEDIADFAQRSPGEAMGPDEAVDFHMDRLAVLLGMNPVPTTKVVEHLDRLKPLLSPYDPQRLEDAFRVVAPGDRLALHIARAAESGRLPAEAHRRVRQAVYGGFSDGDAEADTPGAPAADFPRAAEQRPEAVADTAPVAGSGAVREVGTLDDPFSVLSRVTEEVRAMGGHPSGGVGAEAVRRVWDELGAAAGRDSVTVSGS